MRRILIGTGFCKGSLRFGALIALLFCIGLAFAEEPSPAARYRIEQPSLPLAESLRAIARQTGISVLFDPGAVSGRMSHPVSGQLSAVEAISRALEGTGLKAEVMKDGSIVVKAGAGASSGVPVPVAHAASHPTGAGEGATERVPVAARSPERIEITGSRLKRISSEGPLPVNTYTREDIDRSGQPSLERFLSSLNETSMTQGEGALGGTLGQGSVQLRGLPLGSTLVLINGRRVQAVGSSSANNFNLNLIPLAAVERVEIVPVGSSAVYGGDALAGVVNIILKKSIDGHAMSLRVASGRGIGDGSFSLAAGGSDDRRSFMLLGSVSKATPLTMAERDFFKDADYRRFGGPDARTRSCTPGTVSSTTTANLPGLNSTFAGIPVSAAGEPLTIASFAATAGQANLCNSQANGNGYALVHGTQAVALHALGEQRIGDAWSVFGEATVSHDRLRAVEGGLLLSNVLVPASNPHNPFGVPVRVTARLGLENGSEGVERNTDFTRALVGVRNDLGAGWDFEAVVSTSQDSGNRLLLNNTANSTARTAALAASTPEASLDPFATGRAASEEVLRAIWSDSVRENHGRKDQVSAFVRGSALVLPAGPLETIAGVEFARDTYDTSIPGSTHVVYSRKSGAAYGELRVPLLRADPDSGRPWNLAALTIAGRRDKYSDFGEASTYQAGAEVRPARTVLLRAATATSFKPPTLLQTSVDDLSYSTEALGLLDPARGNAPIVGGQVLRTTNQELRPEQGRAYALGALWEPDAGAGSRLGVTAWRVKVDDLIALLWPQVTLNNEALFPGFVTRGPSVGGVPGPVTRVIYSEINFGRVETAGADFEAAQSWMGFGGKWAVAASATRTSKYGVVIAPGTPVVDRLGRRFVDFWAPKWKGRGSVGFDEGAWSLGVTSRYIGTYKDAGTSERRLGDFWVHDLSGKLDLKKLGVTLGSDIRAASLSLGVVNLSNRQPQFVETSPYYDVSQADWRGRLGTARLSLDW